jgi:hypothetical protein
MAPSNVDPDSDPRPARTNYLRRALGVVICLAPAGVLVASLVCGLRSGDGPTTALGAAVLGVLLGVLNLHLTFLRPLLYLLRHGSTEGLKNVSVVPLIGTLLALAAGTCAFGDPYSASAGLLTLVIDTGGLPWLPIWTWGDRGFWDA